MSTINTIIYLIVFGLAILFLIAVSIISIKFIKKILSKE